MNIELFGDEPMASSTRRATVLILALALASLTFLSSHMVRSENSWLNGWQYRRPIILVSPKTLLDHQIRIVIDTSSLIAAGKMNNNCSDLRITLSDGVTEIPYWIESGCNTNHTVIWIRVPEIMSGKTILYMYYGNPSAKSKSNPKQVFLYYADNSFDTRVIDVYHRGNPAIVQVDKGILKIYLLTSGHAAVSLIPLPPDNYVVEVKAQIRKLIIGNNQVGIFLWNGLARPNDKGYLFRVIHESTDYMLISRMNDEHETRLAKRDLGKNLLGKWLVLRVVKSGPRYNFTVYNATGTALGKLSIVDSTYTPRYLSVHAGYSAGTEAWYDWIRVWRFTGTKISIKLGEEEALGHAIHVVTTTVTHVYNLTRTVTVTKPLWRTITRTVTLTSIRPITIPANYTVTQTLTETRTLTVTARGANHTLACPVTVTRLVTATRTLVEHSTKTITTVVLREASKPSLVSVVIALAVLVAALANLARKR